MFSKITGRSFKVLLSGINSLTSSLSTILVSFLVISFISTELWGEIVYLLMVFDFGFNIISWGNKLFLQQEFSLSPGSIPRLWGTSLISRMPLLLIFIGILFFFSYSFTVLLCLTIWITARFIYQSFEAYIAFERDFNFSLFVESLGLCIIAVPILIFKNELNFTHVIFFYTLSMTIKSIIVFYYYKKIVDNPAKSENNYSTEMVRNYLFSSFPFLLLTFSGLLQSKIDLYAVAYFLKKEELAQYQVYMGFLTISQLIASTMLSPFAKNILRLNKTSFKKMERLFQGVGIFISILIITLIYIVITSLYHFSFSWYMYLLGYVYILLFYFYSTKFYALSKKRAQSTAAILCLAGGVLNLTASIFLVPVLGKEGALLSGVLSQFFMVFIFRNPSIIRKAYTRDED